MQLSAFLSIILCFIYLIRIVQLNQYILTVGFLIILKIDQQLPVLAIALSQLMSFSNKPFQKQVAPKTNIALGRTRQQSRNSYVSKEKKTSHTYLKKDKKQGEGLPKIEESKTLSLIQMYDKQQFQIENKSFDQLWRQLINYSSHLLNFMLFSPIPLNDEGKKLIKNGRFLKMWLKILSLNPFVNHFLIVKNAYDQYKEQIISGSQQFQIYCSSILNMASTPIKSNKKQGVTSLKRSILKNSQKKVQFKKDQIIYPPLQPYKSLSSSQSIKDKKIMQIKANHGFLLDFFQINDIFFLDQVEFIGHLASIENKYAILLVKYNEKQLLCIGILEGCQEQIHDPQILQQIEKRFQNLSYLELQGKDPQSFIVNTFPSHINT